MQAITFPEAVSSEVVRRTLLEVAWRLFIDRALNADSFVDMISLNAADGEGAALYIESVKMVIAEDAINVARHLVERGLQHYPDNHTLQHYRDVLVPPAIISSTPATQDFSKTMRWLSDHSHEYVGQWLAVQDGLLIGRALSRKALVEQLGRRAEQPDVMLTKIPLT